MHHEMPWEPFQPHPLPEDGFEHDLQFCAWNKRIFHCGILSRCFCFLIFRIGMLGSQTWILALRMLGQFHSSLTFEFTVKCLAAKRDGDKKMPFCYWVWTGTPVTRLETWSSRDLCSVHPFSFCSISNEDAVLTSLPVWGIRRRRSWWVGAVSSSGTLMLNFYVEPLTLVEHCC